MKRHQIQLLDELYQSKITYKPLEQTRIKLINSTISAIEVNDTIALPGSTDAKEIQFSNNCLFLCGSKYDERFKTNKTLSKYVDIIYNKPLNAKE
jgi:hypothetical protein